MTSSGILSQIIQVLTKPASGWKQVRSASQSGALVFFVLLTPLYLLISWAYYHGQDPAEAQTSALMVRSAIQSVSGILGLLFCVVILPKLSGTFSSSITRNLAFKLMTFAWIPVLMGDLITFLTMGQNFFQILYLYTIYLMWEGVEVMAGTQGERKLGFVFILLIFAFGAIYVCNRVLVQVAFAAGLFS
jgi:hypothetical protein